MGRVTVAGGKVGMEAPSGGILASDLAVGSTVKLMENGTAVEYLVIHNGRPSTLYDSSCDGLWLLRKKLYATKLWSEGDNNNIYSTSYINTYLNGTFFNVLGIVERETIKQVKIPYVNGNGSTGAVASGANGLSIKVFLLGGYEVGFTTATNRYFPVDGVCLSYFSGASNSVRVAYLNNSVVDWWLRSAFKRDKSNVWCVNSGGKSETQTSTNALGIRPTLILPNTAIFDEETMLLKGVA